MRHCLLTASILSLFLLPCRLESQVDTEPADYLGCWVGSFVVGREANEVRVGVRAEGDDVLASIWIPEMKAGPLPMGEVTTTGGGVSFGPLFLEIDGDQLTGVLPPSLDPGDSLAVRFRRSGWLEADCETTRALALEAAWDLQLRGGVWARALGDEDRGQIVVGTLAGEVVAVDFATGSVHWRTSLPGSIRSAAVLWRGGLYVVADDGLVRSLDLDSGRVLRKFRIANSLRPAHQEAPGESFHYRGHQLLPQDDRLLVATLDGQLHAIDGEGKLSRVGAPLEGSFVALAPAADGFFAATLEGEVARLDREGRVTWRRKLAGPVQGDLVVHDSGLYVGDRGYYLWCLDPLTGSPRWKRKFFFSWVESSPVFADGLLFVGSSDSKRTRALDPETGAVHWSADTSGWPWAPPLVVGGLVVQAMAGQKAYLTPLDPGIVFFDEVSGKKVAELEAAVGGKGVWGYAVSPISWEGLLIAFGTRGEIQAWRLAEQENGG